MIAVVSQPYAPPQGQLVVNLRKPFGLLSSSMISPKLSIDGYPAPVRWEQNAYPVVAGRHRLQVSATYLWEYGRAECEIDIPPGQTVEVHYSPPLLTFIGGRMGPAPQPRPGMVAFWLLLGVPLLIILITIIAVLASAGGS